MTSPWNARLMADVAEKEASVPAKNPMGKSRPAADPYLTIVDGSWTTKVLKAYTTDPGKPYARWFCLVVTPYTGPMGDMGDTYIDDITGRVVQRDASVPDDALPARFR